MTKPYYQDPSPIGKPILDLLVPQEYHRSDCIQTIWAIEDEGQGSFNQYNIIKYLWRLGQKDPDYRDDLSKAIQYIDWEIEYISQLKKDLQSYFNPRIHRQESLVMGVTASDLTIQRLEEVKGECIQLLKKYKDEQI